MKTNSFLLFVVWFLLSFPSMGILLGEEHRFDLRLAPSLAWVQAEKQNRNGFGSATSLSRYTKFSLNHEYFMKVNFDFLSHGMDKKLSSRSIHDALDHRMFLLGLGWAYKNQPLHFFNTSYQGRTLASFAVGWGFTKISRRESSDQVFIRKHAEDISGQVFRLATSHQIGLTPGSELSIELAHLRYLADLRHMTSQASGDSQEGGFQNGLSLKEANQPFSDLPKTLSFSSTTLSLGLTIILR